MPTGYGRTGRFLGREHSGVMPDACSLAKGIGGGFPLAAMMLREKLAGALPVGAHGTTFGGNPLGAAAALAVLKIFDDEKLIERAQSTGEHLTKRLDAIVADKEIPAAAERRGLGLLQGIRVHEAYDAMTQYVALRDRKTLMSIAGGDVLRLAPPLNVSIEDVDRACDTLRDVLRKANPKDA